MFFCQMSLPFQFSFHVGTDQSQYTSLQHCGFYCLCFRIFVFCFTSNVHIYEKIVAMSFFKNISVSVINSNFILSCITPYHHSILKYLFNQTQFAFYQGKVKYRIFCMLSHVDIDRLEDLSDLLNLFLVTSSVTLLFPIFYVILI